MKFDKKVKLPSVRVDMTDVDDDDVNEIAGMLRGLACAIEGFKSNSNMTNEKFWTERPVEWKFSSVKKAQYFKECVEYYFADYILHSLKVKVRRAALRRLQVRS